MINDSPISDWPQQGTNSAEIHQGLSLKYPQDKCIHQLFEAQVAKNPEGVAIECNGDKFSYKELNEQANRLANYLIETHVAPQSLVGICISRSFNMVVGIIATFKAGCTYVALDPEYPDVRRQYILNDSQIDVVLTESNFINKINTNKTVLLDKPKLFEHCAEHNPKLCQSSEQLAYVIYTSGSTGNPKGVAIRHRNTCAMLHWARSIYSDIELSRVLASTSLNFDLSVFELFVPLCFGFQTIIVKNILTLFESDINVSLINTVPSAIRLLIDQDAIPANVETINLAGEPLTANIINALLERNTCNKVCNLYGPTEDTSYSTYAEFTQPINEVPHIGRPIANSQAYVMSEEHCLLPTGSVGELYLGGDGVAQGYLNRSQLTEKKFITNSYGQGELYRTGDLVRFNNDGCLEFIGRIDDQVKIRGFRVELGEINHQILQHPEITSAIVIASDDQNGEKHLIAYVVSDRSEHIDDKVLVSQLRQHLQSVMPDYMQPAAFVVLDTLPLNLTGKIDKNALPAPDFSMLDEYIAPSNTIECGLVTIWKSVLKINKDMSVNTSFFDLGGQSLLATKLMSSINLEFGVLVSLTEIFEAETIQKIGKIIVHNVKNSARIEQQRVHKLHQERIGELEEFDL